MSEVAASSIGETHWVHSMIHRASELAKSTLEPWLPFLVAFIALAVRLIYLLDSSDNPTFFNPIVDAAKHHWIATDVAEGEGLGRVFDCCRPFFYPLWLSAIYSIAGPSILAAKILQALLGAFTCGLTYRLARTVFGTTTGTLAALLVAFNGPLVFWEAELVSSGWGAFWSVALALLLVRSGSSKSPSSLLLLGACGACAITTRASFLPFFFCAWIWIGIKLVQTRNRPTWIATRICVSILGFALIAIPVAMQSYRAAGNFGIVPASGGINAYLGNNPDRCKTLTLRPGREFLELMNMGREAGFRTLPEQSDFFYAKVRAYGMEDPISFAGGLAHKALQYASGREIPRNIDIYTFREWSQFLRVSVWKAGGFAFPWGVLFPFALLGLLSRWREIPTPLVLFAALYPLLSILVFTSGRYRSPAIPIFSILAALGVQSFMGWIRQRHGTHILAGGGLAVSIAVLTSLPAPFCEELPSYEAEMYAFLAILKRTDGDEMQAEQFARRALELDPLSRTANEQLGLIHASKGELGRAIIQFDRAIAIRDDYWLRYRRGLVHVRTKDFVAAEQDFRAAVSMKENFINGYLELGKSLDALGKHDEARRAREEALGRGKGQRAGQRARSSHQQVP